MNEPKTLARPYALAAYRFASQQQQVETWSIMLANLCGVVMNDSMQKILHRPMIDQDAWLKILQPVMQKYLDTNRINFLRLLIAHHRLELAPVIGELFEVIKADAENTTAVTITTAITLNDIEQKKLVAMLGQQLGKKILPRFKVDSAIIAGAIIAVGEKYVLDDALSSQLARLKIKFQS